MRTNKEVCRIYQELGLVAIIKTPRLKWPGHVNRMEDHRELKSATGYSWKWKERKTKKEVAG
jgi:hypothetical protein